MKRSHKRMKGGFLDTIGSTLSGWGSTLSNTAKGAWDKTKSATSDAYNSAVGTSETPTTPSSQPVNTYPPSSPPSYPSNYTTGGKKSKKNKRGGYSANSSLTNLASRSASFTGSTAKPHTYVGGKKSKRHHKKHKHTKSCKHKKHNKH